MVRKRDQFCLDIKFCLGESLFDEDCLSKIESLLRRELKPWISELRVWKEDENKHRPMERFASDVQRAATERGALYDSLVKLHGPGPFTRRAGSVELHGADNALAIVLNLDEYLFAPSAGRWLWGNTVTLQVRAQHSGATAAVEFARRFTESACIQLSPWYAHGYLSEEWARKNISREGGGMLAIGLDASRYLPGLYWMNFFGRPYCSLIGSERLLNAPGCEAKKVDAGVLLYLSPTPEDWEVPEYHAAETAVMRHLGQQYFFNPHDVNGRTVAPDFGLKSLPRNPRFT